MLGREVLLDERDPRALGADSLSYNAGELWALAEALLWLRSESNGSGRVPVTLVYDSEVAKGLVTEPWAPHSVRSHGRETDPAKRLLPLNVRADRLAVLCLAVLLVLRLRVCS